MADDDANDWRISTRLAPLVARIQRLEAQVKLLSDQAGIPFEDASDGVPEEVVELARAGKKLDAMTRYRALTGADVNEARKVVDQL